MCINHKLLYAHIRKNVHFCTKYYMQPLVKGFNCKLANEKLIVIVCKLYRNAVTYLRLL